MRLAARESDGGEFAVVDDVEETGEADRVSFCCCNKLNNNEAARGTMPSSSGLYDPVCCAVPIVYVFPDDVCPWKNN